MSCQREINLKNARAKLLDEMFSQAQVHPENTDIIVKKLGKRPEISPYGAIQNGQLEKNENGKL